MGRARDVPITVPERRSPPLKQDPAQRVVEQNRDCTVEPPVPRVARRTRLVPEKAVCAVHQQEGLFQLSRPPGETPLDPLATSVDPPAVAALLTGEATRMP